MRPGRPKAFLASTNREGLVANIDNWGRFIFLPNLKLLEGITEILGATLRLGKQKTEIPLIKFGEIMSSIGVDRHRFIDTFQVVTGPVPGSVRMLKGEKKLREPR